MATRSVQSKGGSGRTGVETGEIGRKLVARKDHRAALPEGLTGKALEVYDSPGGRVVVLFFLVLLRLDARMGRELVWFGGVAREPKAPANLCRKHLQNPASQRGR